MGTENTAFAKQYTANLKLRVQQGGSVLRNTVEVDTDFTGEFKFYDRLDATAMIEKVSRHMDTPEIDPDYQRRRVGRRDFVHAFLLDKEDELAMLCDPQSKYVRNAAMAAGRTIDDRIVAAASGTAYSGQDGSTSTTLASYDSGSHVIAHGGTSLTLTKLLQMKKLFDLEDIDPNEERFIICTAYEIEDLLNTTEIKNADYNTSRVLSNGRLESFLGFKFIQTNRLSRSGGITKCLAYTKSAIQLAVARDITAKIDVRPDKNYATQVWTALSIDAVRLDEKLVIECSCQSS